ncbi:MAG: CorA family divalent cation transporter [Nitrospira sp.]
MLNTYKRGTEVWVDIDHGTPEEIHEMMNTYNIHPFVAKELTSATPKPRVEFHDHYIYCILHFPVFKHTHSEGASQEIDFIIGQDAIITARYDTIDALHKFAKELEVEEILDKGDSTPKHSHTIFTGLLRGLYISLFEELEYIEDTIEQITNKIFKGEEKKMVVSISEITRTLLEFKRVTDLHREILEALRERGRQIFGDRFSNEMQAIILDYQKINTSIKSNLEMLRELRETDNSLLTAKQTETIKRLSLVGAILFVISIIVALIQ